MSVPQQVASSWLGRVTGDPVAVTAEIPPPPQQAPGADNEKEARALTLAVKDMTGAMRHLLANKAGNGSDAKPPPGGKSAPRDADVSHAVRKVKPDTGCCGAGKALPMVSRPQALVIPRAPCCDS